MLAAGARVRLAGPDVPGSPLHSLAPQFMRASGVTRTLPLLQTLREGELPIGPGLTLYAQYALHPGTTLAYRLDAYGRRIVFCPAHAPSPDPAARDSHDARKFRTLFSAADVLVHGFSRSLSERGDGAAWEAVVDHAAAAGVKQLLLVPLDGAVPADLPERVAARASALRLEARLATGEVRVVL